MKFTRDKRQETIIYIVLWGLLFTAPVLSLYIRTTNDASLEFDWREVFTVWRQLGIFFAVFLVHNHLLAPLLVYRQKRTAYFTLVALLVAAFAFYQYLDRPQGKPRSPRQAPSAERMIKHRRPPLDLPPDAQPPRDLPPDVQPHDLPPDAKPHDLPPDAQPPRDLPPDAKPSFRRRDMGRPDDVPPPMILSQHDIVAVIILILMLGMNVGIKLYFKQRRDQLQMAKLEKQHLEQQLEYLKYQLNPHFLMNTLNNIHALVDIDPERSKEVIIQLSKMLRYVLYESNRERVPLAQEFTFMENYTQLMRIRYTDKLRLKVSQPDAAGIQIPPLLFISFVENAFKHGVSYQQESFINIDCQRYEGKHGDDRLRWTCLNSKPPRPKTADDTPRQGGVGLANVRQRLDILYGTNYTLDVSETDTTYQVILDIPLDK